ncbi:MAG: SO2930 family diheme c-type cytochrome [Sphingopyxis sp.]
MRQALTIIAALVIATVSLGARDDMRVNDAAITADALPPLLSDYGFFDDSPDRPSRTLIRYDLQTPLFSDYAVKTRFIYLPTGTRMTAHGEGLVEFPVGAAIIKSFAFRQPDGSLRTVETRVLLHRASGWVALPYIWRADGSDADLRLAGGRDRVSLVDDAGQARTISYAVPNRNQCRTCHQRDEVVMPIGPTLRTMISEQRLDDAIDAAPYDARAESVSAWRSNATDYSLDQRARAYLDANCAHCHNPHGSASNSGLFLEYMRPFGMAVGAWKRPVAAGRGSGALDYAIVPGDPAHSILLYRMRSTDPGVAMPELGRSLVHDEGAALIEQWIAAMPAATPPTGAAP